MHTLIQPHPDEAPKPIVVVVGAPRSGTYLLVTHLERYFSTAIPLETHFIPLFRRWKFLWGNLSRETNRRQIVEDIYTFLEIWSKASRVAGEDMASHNLLSTLDKLDEIVASTDNYDEIVQSMFRHYAVSHGKSFAGEKSAFYSLIPVSGTANSFGQSVRVIHIIRDGRDVARSWTSMWTGPETLTAAALLWRRHVRDKCQWGLENPDNYLELKYEDLLRSPNECHSKISLFLGIQKQTADIDDLSEVISKLPTHTKIAGGLETKNAYKWQREMPLGDQKLFTYYAADALSEHGYPVPEFRYGLVDKLYYAIIRMGGAIIMTFSVRRWKNRIKNILPLLLWIARKSRLQRLIIELAK